jgi:hypothetical protein
MSDPYEADFVDDEEDLQEPEDELDDEPPEEDDAPDEPDEEPDDERPAPQRRPTRGENRVAAATRIAAEAKREADALKAEVAALKATQSQPAAETAAQRQARLAEMEPWERSEYLQNERMTRLETITLDRTDKAAFEALCARDPTAAKMADEVERELSALRARGQNVDRDTMYTHLLGQKARAQSTRASGRAQRAAAANRDRQTTRPGSARSDTSPADRRETNTKAARDKRLENYQL